MKLLAREFRLQISRLKSFDRILIAITAAFMLLLSLVDAGALTLLSTTLKGSSSQSLMKHAPILVLIVFLFIAKSLLSALITYWSMRHFEKIEFQLGEENVKKFRTANWAQVRGLSAVDLANYFEKNPNAVATSLLFSGALFMSEAITGVAITFVLLKESFFSSLVALVFIAVVALVQNRLLGRLSEKIGTDLIHSNNEVQRRTQEIARLGKILKISNGEGLYDRLNSYRKDMIRSRNTAWYLGSVPRYYMEAVLATGLVIVTGASFVEGGADAIFPALSLFAAAGYRLLPTVNRMQGYALTAISALPYIKIHEGLILESKETSGRQNSAQHPDDKTLIELKGVSFRFQDSEKDVLKEISIKLLMGNTYALVGPSGSGKTTLADLCLGLLEPTDGEVLTNAQITFAYVPQETFLIKGTIADNVTLGERLDLNSLDKSLENAEARDLASRFKFEELSEISGGQKQRIGVARALYRNANFTVFDEATSALDNVTENLVVENLKKMKSPNSTLLIIAHRLSSVRDVDKVVYLENGSIVGFGTWDDLMETCQPFRAAVKLGELDK